MAERHDMILDTRRTDGDPDADPDIRRPNLPAVSCVYLG